MLTTKQQAVLDYLREVQMATGLIPSTREIQEHFGFASQTSAITYLKALERAGAIRRRPGIARGVMLHQMRSQEAARRSDLRQIPIYGTIPAGMATAEEQMEEEACITIDLSTLDLPMNSRTFALRVRGDSMVDAHIVEGDIVVMEFKEARHGDIVAALIDGETTLKRYLVEKGKPYLKAENARYRTLIPAQELVIQGVLIFLLRECRSGKRSL